MYNPPCKNFLKIYHWSVPDTNKDVYMCGECGQLIKFENISKIAIVINIHNDRIRKVVSSIAKIFNTKIEGIDDYTPASYNWLPEKEYRIITRKNGVRK